MGAKVGLSAMRLVVEPWAEAGRLLEDARRRHPRFADRRQLLGLLYLAQGNPGSAAGEFEAALAANSGYARARFGRLLALRLRDGFLDPALWHHDKVLDGVAEPQRSLWTAWFLVQGGDRAAARSVLERLAGIPERAALAWFVRGVYEAAWGETAASRASLESAALAHPLYREILARRGWVGGAVRGARGSERRSGAGSSCAAALRCLPTRETEAIAWNPAGSDLFEHVGDLAARHRLFGEAEELYEEAFLRDGGEALYRVRLARLAVARGDEEAAVESLRGAVEIDPASAQARVALGFEYQSQGFQDEALVQFEVAARLRPGYPDVQHNLGLLYASAGRTHEALKCLRRALEINPRYFQARTTLAHLLRREGDAEGALREFAVLIEQGVRSADLHVQKAETHHQVGELQEAVEELQAAIRTNPSYARSYYVLGGIYREQGLRRKAQRAWQQYLEATHAWRDEPPVFGEE